MCGLVAVLHLAVAPADPNGIGYRLIGVTPIERPVVLGLFAAATLCQTGHKRCGWLYL